MVADMGKHDYFWDRIWGDEDKELVPTIGRKQTPTEPDIVGDYNG